MLRAACGRPRAPGTVFSAVCDAARQRAVTQEVVDYLARHARQDEVLERVASETAEMPRAEMVTTPDEAALLTLLARLLGARRALEIGTFTGYGAISIARGLAAGGRLTCLELDEKYAAIARRNLEEAGVADRVELIVGPAMESLRAMPAEPTYDYVFLDADKTGYPDYYEELVPRLLAVARARALLLLRTSTDSPSSRGVRARIHGKAGASSAPNQTAACRGMKIILGGLLSGSDLTVGSPGTGAFWENAGGQAVLDDALRARACLFWPPLRLARVVL